MNQTQLKKTIDFNKSFRSLLQVIKTLALAEYHILERKLKVFDELYDLSGGFFDSIDLTTVEHPFLRPGGRPPAVIAITSDTGLMGGINQQVVMRALEIVRENGGHLVILGERGQMYVQDAGVEVTSFPGINDAKRYEQACHLRDFISKNVLAGKIGGVKVVYPRAVSFVVHRVEVATLLPFSLEKKEGASASPVVSMIPSKNPVIFESKPSDVVEYLVYVVMGQKLYEIFGMSRVTEQAARFLHLEESCNKILEMNHKLLLQYFRKRHETIDANMRELYSARMLYAE